MLTGRPILDATTTVMAEASSMLNPLNTKNVSVLRIFTHIAALLAKHSKHVAYLEGVMGVRSFPMVWITLRPHTQSPVQMPTPPYRSSQIGVGELDVTEPLSYRSHRAMSGPIALLVKKMRTVMEYEAHLDINSTHINSE